LKIQLIAMIMDSLEHSMRIFYAVYIISLMTIHHKQ